MSVTREEFTLERLSDTATQTSQPLEPSAGLAAQLYALAPGEIVRLPLAEEEIIVQKRPVVTRELVIGKRLVRDIREFSETIRREDARITFEPAVADRGVDQAPGQASRSPVHPAPARTGLGESEQRTLALSEEELHVHTETVEKGVVKVQTGVLLERGSVAADLLHEEVTVDEQTVEARPSERELLGGDSYDVPEYGEQVSLRKQPVIVEEITIDVGAVEAKQEISTTLRREEARVTVEGDVPLNQTRPAPRPQQP